MTPRQHSLYRDLILPLAGVVITHQRMTNGVQDARVAGRPDGHMTTAENREYCNLVLDGKRDRDF